MLLTGISCMLILLILVLLFLIYVDQQRSQTLRHTHETNQLLADIVQKRNQELVLLQAQLVNYAHLNSHQVRGPLARIMGLTHLLQSESDPCKREQLIGYVNLSVNELDDIINEINICLIDIISEERLILSSALASPDTEQLPMASHRFHGLAGKGGGEDR